MDGKAVGYGGGAGTSLCSFDGKTYNWTNGLLSGFTRGNATEGSEKYTYRYNGHGQRIGKTYTFTPGTVTLIEYTTNESYDYYYNGDGTLHMMTHDTITKLGDNTYRKLVFLYDSTGVAGCVYIKNTNAPTVYRFVKNSLGDIVAILDDAGDTKAEYLYDAYGNYTIWQDSTGGFAEENPFRYRGYFYDTETGFYYCQTRYYNPAWGRFISMDDVDYVDPQAVSGLNLYAYCNNDPINFSDPTGHSILATVLITVALVAGAVGGGIVGGHLGKEKGHSGWALAGDILAGISAGVALAGAVIAGTAVMLGATHLFGVTALAAQSAYGIGALAVDQFVFITLPLAGMAGAMEPLEYEKPKPVEIPQPLPSRPYYK